MNTTKICNLEINEDAANEFFYLLDDYGLVSFLEIASYYKSLHDLDDSETKPGFNVDLLNELRIFFERSEEYEKCIKIRDCISLL
jgi:hypothetical protein